MPSAVERSAVFLLAQNRLLREALTRILDKKNDLQVVGASAFTPEVADQIPLANPHVLIMDCSAGTESYFELVRHFHEQLPHLKAVLIGMEPDEPGFLRAVRAGALGYVLKDASALEVVATVRAVAAGEAVAPPQLCASLFRYVARQSVQAPSYRIKIDLGLTSREQQLVFLIGQGMTNKEIALQLQLAEQTVRNHVHRMLRKVGANDRLAVVEMCRSQGLPV
jgi:DNA-binding NarL/FixJ family response regulator